MAYRFDPDGSLVFDGWERGISSGPYSIFTPSALGPINQTGTVDLSYGNILGIPGEFSVQYPLAAGTITTSGGSSMKTPVQITKNIPTSNSGIPSKYYLIDGQGQIFVSSPTTGTPTVFPINWTYQGKVAISSTDAPYQAGLVWWQGYLLGFYGGAITYSNDDGVTNHDWSGTTGSLVTAVPHYAISSQVSDTVYFCNGNGVASIVLTPGQTFDPANAATFTFNSSAVNIPGYDTANCLAELNGQVLIGGSINRVYPWDAQNLSGTGITSLTGLPLFIGDNFIQRIVVTNANAYVFTSFTQTPIGTPASRGNIYITNGSTIDLYQKMPDNIVSVSGTVSQIQEPYWQFGDAMFHRNMLIFGARASDVISGNTINGTGGVWAIDLNSGALFRLNQMTSDTNETALPFVLSPYYAQTGVNGPTAIQGLGYMAGTTGIMDSSSNTLSTSARVITDKVPVGTYLNPKTFEQIELKLAVALVSGESIDVSVYSDANPTGISVGSMIFGDGMSRVFKPLPFQNLQWMQVKCVLNPTNTAPTFVRLREIRCI